MYYPVEVLKYYPVEASKIILSEHRNVLQLVLYSPARASSLNSNLENKSMYRQFRIFLSRREAARLEKSARRSRRAFRDYCRLEWSRIRHAEIRARGLRLFAAWSTPQPSELAGSTLLFCKPLKGSEPSDEVELATFYH